MSSIREEDSNVELNLSFFEFVWPLISNAENECNGLEATFTRQFLSILEKATERNWMIAENWKELANVGRFSSYIGENGNHVILRYYMASQLATVDIQEMKENAMFSHDVVEKMLNLLKERHNVVLRRPYFTFPRVSAIPRLYCTSDERVMVYNFDKVLCDVQSQYQRVQILHSNEFGNTLILDDVVNLAEKDVVYTHQLMWKGRICYDGKDVLVLGGGDGGLLNELMKEGPKFVTMVEIDRTVIDLCKKYLRGVCGDSLDCMVGASHQIVIDDCFNQLEQFDNSGRRFDVVFSDLTDVPLVRDGEKGRREFWSLMRRTLEMGLRVLKPNGCFLTHLVGLSATDVLDEYERILNEWRTPSLRFERAEVMVPSFLEVWTFYRIWTQAEEEIH